MQNSIETIFDHVLEVVPNIELHLKDLHTINSTHIYNDLTTILSLNYDTVDLSKLDDYFSNSQAVLKACKVKNFVKASNYIKIIDSIIEHLHPDVEKYMGLIYLPMLAYYQYSLKNYSIAIKHLNNAIELIDILSLNSTLNLVSAKIDQKMNIVKVLFSSGQHQSGQQLGHEIILFLLKGKIAKHFNHKNLEEYENLPEKDMLKLVHYVISGYTRRVVHLIKTKPQNEISILTQSFSKLWENEDFILIHYKAIYVSLNILKYYCAKKPAHFMSSISEFLHKCDKVPKVLQFLIFERIILFAKKLDYSKYGQLLNAIDQYYTSKINLKI